MEVKSITEQKSLLATLSPGKRARLRRLLFDYGPGKILAMYFPATGGRVPLGFDRGIRNEVRVSLIDEYESYSIPEQALQDPSLRDDFIGATDVGMRHARNIRLPVPDVPSSFARSTLALANGY